MSRLGEVETWLRGAVPELLKENDVPAAAVAVAAGPELVEVATGVLSKETGVEATTDSVFQIGSVTKVLTATLVMQLVEEGLVDLDQPARTYLPHFRVADHSAAAAITVRQLLCHTSGFEGDIFTDTGKGDEALARYVDLLHDTPQLFAPGEMFSYNNAGFSVLGRIIEVLRGTTYDECLRSRLLRPLGMTHTAMDPYEAVLFRAAVGHLRPSAEEEPEPATTWAMARSNAPAGSMLAMRPRDLVAFARMHLRGDGPLGTAGVEAMREEQVRLPDIGWGAAWGLGWELYDDVGGPLFGHDGNTIGQSAMLRVAPERGVVLVVLTNGGSAHPVQAAIAERVLGDLAGIRPPSDPVPDAGQKVADADRYLGTYLSSTSRTEISKDDEGRVWLDRTPEGIGEDLGDLPFRTELVGWRGDSLLPLSPEDGGHAPVAFLGDDGHGRARYLHSGRADVRVADAPHEH